MTEAYYRPLVQSDEIVPEGAVRLLGGSLWFSKVVKYVRGAEPSIVSPIEVPSDILRNLTTLRPKFAGLDISVPSIMGILNTTPDSFSDGGQHNAFDDAVKTARDMLLAGADVIDIGGESTRPGADFVEATEEIKRTVPVIEALNEAGINSPISIDTRKASVAEQAISAGAQIFNDVTALTFDEKSLQVANHTGAYVILMHSGGDPKTMQDDPQYSDVLLDVYDYLSDRINTCVEAGIARDKIMIDPGIGFGKTLDHNIALLRGIALFHSLGCPILLGVSRKGFIGKIGNAQQAADRAPGSIAVALDALSQGVQMLRVHDVAETKQAVALWMALNT